jgi:hypothetical protein
LVDTVTCCPFCAVHTLVHVGRLRPSIIRSIREIRVQKDEGDGVSCRRPLGRDYPNSVG